MNELLQRIAIDPEVCGGKPCVRGTRLWVSLILDLLADGATEAELRADHPQLAHEDVLAAIAYGAEAARERVIAVPAGRGGVKLKLDENIGRIGAELLRTAGHDVSTVGDRGLQGAKDQVLFDTRAREGRTLVTLDRDFGQVMRFPPERSAGVVILELGPRATNAALLDRLRAFVAVAAERSLARALWIVEPGRVSVHLSEGEDRDAKRACGLAE